MQSTSLQNLKHILQQKVSVLPQVGQNRLNLFKKLNIVTIADLILHVPYRYKIRKIEPSVNNIEIGDAIVKKVKIESANITRIRKRPSKIICKSDDRYFQLVYFGAPPAHNIKHIAPGNEVIVTGDVNNIGDYIEIIHPEKIIPANESVNSYAYEPIYNACNGLNSKFIWGCVKNVLMKIPNIPEWLPQDVINKNNWPSFKDCLWNLHNPKNMETVEKAQVFRDRLSFDEALSHQMVMKQIKNNQDKRKKTPLQFKGNLKQKLLKILPFELTDGQKAALHEIEVDLQSNKVTNRLIQGDVGCGKTIVALLSAIDVIESGHQAAIMAPTEVLAQQHYVKLKSLLDPLGIKCTFLAGSLKIKQKRLALKEIESGESNLVIGTHALFQEKVVFNSLKLITIDEQHRFGVKQRQALAQKGDQTSIIMMSATPIPRTLEIALYGDMDVSKIITKPNNRKSIITSSLSVSKVDDLTKSLEKKLEKNEKVYWICPLIEKSEKIDLAHIEYRLEYLNNFYPGKVGVIHGKMKQDEKDKVMDKFSNGDVDILIATTVIEVGIDVGNATLIVIENSENFGLAQLHQLRGRVGRSDLQSHCVLLYSNKVGKTSKFRIETMKKSNDGFYIAEEDLKIRGAGDITGTRQSGALEFKVLDIDTQSLLLEKASYMVNTNIINSDYLMAIFDKSNNLEFSA